MRSPGILICAALSLCAAGAAHAQQKQQARPAEKSMIERYTEQPDYNLSYKDSGIKSFGGSKMFSSTESSRLAKPFSLLKVFRMKSFTTSPYNSPSFWAGNFKFKTTDANVKATGPLSGLVRLFKTKSAETKVAPQAGKTFASREAPLIAEKGTTVVKGKIQNKIDKEGPSALANGDGIHQDSSPGQPVKQGDKLEVHSIDYNGSMHALTVDDVRDLLGKSK